MFNFIVFQFLNEELALSFETDFISSHPLLKEHIFIEPPSNINLGIGLVPLGAVKNKLFIGLDVFQLNWTFSFIDWEILSTTIGFVFPQDNTVNAKYFLALTKPKIRISKKISIGLLAGYEFVIFPNLTSFIEKNNYVTPDQPFSSSSFVYGFSASQYLSISNSYNLKISELFFKEHYSVEKTQSGWNFNFSKNSQAFDKATVAPSWVFLLEIALII